MYRENKNLKLTDNLYSLKMKNEGKEGEKNFENKEKKINAHTIKNEEIKNLNLNFDTQKSDLQRKFAEPSIHEKPKEIDLDFEQKANNFKHFFEEEESGTKQFVQPCTKKEELIITNFEVTHEYSIDTKNKDKQSENSINKIEASHLTEKNEVNKLKNIRSDPTQNFEKKEIENNSQISKKDFLQKENSYKSEEDEDFAESNDHYENKVDQRNQPTSIKNLKEQKNSNHQNFMSQKDLFPKRNYHYKEDNEEDFQQEKKPKPSKKKHSKNERSKHSRKRQVF